MTLTAQMPGATTVYATEFVGGDWNPAARATALNNQPAPSPSPTTEAELLALLASTSPEYDTIDLPANTTIVLTQPIEITHSVAILGNNSTLLFQQGSTAAWPASASGAILRGFACVRQHSAHALGLHHRVRHDQPAQVEQSRRSRAGAF